jgi:hypothetical protein
VGAKPLQVAEDWSTVEWSARIVYWEEDDDDSDEDQLRSVSDYIAEEERNSEHDAEGLFSRLEGVSSGIIHNSSTNFATSEAMRQGTPPLLDLLPHPSEVPKLNQMTNVLGPQLTQNLKQMPKTQFILFRKHGPKLSETAPKSTRQKILRQQIPASLDQVKMRLIY